MSEDEWIRADQILALVQERYNWQVTRLQETLGVIEKSSKECKNFGKTPINLNPYFDN